MDLTPRQNQIIDVAMSLIAEKGIENLTIKNIAARTGISEAAVYRHFESKYQIVMTLLDRFEERGNKLLREMQQQEGGALKKIEYFIFDRYKLCAAEPNVAKVMFSEEHFQGDKRFSERMLAIMRTHSHEIHSFIRQGQSSGEIRSDISTMAIFRTVFGAVRLLVKQWCLSDYSFDLLGEGHALWEAQKLMLTANRNS